MQIGIILGDASRIPDTVDEYSKGGVTVCGIFLSNLSRNADISRWRIARCNMLPLQLVSRHLLLFCTHNVARSRTQFYFLQRLQQLSITVTQCNTPPETCLAMLARSANQDPYYPLLGPPRSQFCELHSVTPCSCNCNTALLNVVRQVARKIV